MIKFRENAPGSQVYKLVHISKDKRGNWSERLGSPTISKIRHRTWAALDEQTEEPTLHVTAGQAIQELTSVCKLWKRGQGFSWTVLAFDGSTVAEGGGVV